MNVVEEKVAKVAGEVMGRDPLSIRDSFDDMDMDSLDVVEFVMGLEEEFAVEVPDEVAEEWHTLEDASKYFQQLPPPVPTVTE